MGQRNVLHDYSERHKCHCCYHCIITMAYCSAVTANKLQL